jgi:hypothetical protein
VTGVYATKLLISLPPVILVRKTTHQSRAIFMVSATPQTKKKTFPRHYSLSPAIISMVPTMRSADVLSAMDPSKLYVKLSSSSEVGVMSDGMVPTAFPVSPSHSSLSSTDPLSSNSGASSEDEESEQDKEPFMAMLIADPLYIHGQILLELAAKEQRDQSMMAAANHSSNAEGQNPNSAENTNDHGGHYDLESFYAFDGFHSDSVLPHHGEEQVRTFDSLLRLVLPWLLANIS